MANRRRRHFLLPRYRNIERVAVSELDRVADIVIPNTPLKFFRQHIGALRHPDTGKPSQLKKYQTDFFFPKVQHKFKMMIKSHKIGFSTSTLIEDLWHALADCAGYDGLIISQKQQLANDHLATLHRTMMESPTLSRCVIKKAPIDALKTERTKAEVLFVQSPMVRRPSRIIALGFSAASIESWKDVKWVHMSDTAINKLKNDAPVYGAATSRLAMSNGWFTVETIPGGQRGWVWNAYTNAAKQNIYTKTLSYDVAVAAGLMTEEFIDRERAIHGPMFPALYEGAFLTSLSAAYPEKMVEEMFAYDYSLEL